MSRKLIGIIGGAGYTGGEMLRLLRYHPDFEIAYVHSNSQAGLPVAKVHQDLVDVELTFTNELHWEIDALVLCVGHGDARIFMEENTPAQHLKVIDLSQDHRLDADDHAFIYGLPEWQRTQIRKAQFVANPGCFATCIQLALLPLANAQTLNGPVHVSGITGSTGAGQKLQPTTHFTWRNNNISVYKAFTHQHLNEIGQTLRHLQGDFNYPVHFIPYRGNFTRGIITTCYTTSQLSVEQAYEVYNDFYRAHPFTHVIHSPPAVKQVVNTNQALVYLEKHGDQLMVTSVIDNLLKGASGQALQNLNLMMGHEETSGLKLKASAF